MRLRDLDAQLVYDARPNSYRRSDVNSVEGMQGVLFQCPKCATGLIVRHGATAVGEEDGRRFVRGAHYVRVYFSNPQGVAAAPLDCDDSPRWLMTGASTDDLTLRPSVDLTHDRDGKPIDGCGWHGWVTNGAAE